jgi:hypothetical protein
MHRLRIQDRDVMVSARAQGVIKLEQIWYAIVAHRQYQYHQAAGVNSLVTANILTTEMSGERRSLAIYLHDHLVGAKVRSRPV